MTTLETESTHHVLGEFQWSTEPCLVEHEQPCRLPGSLLSNPFVAPSYLYFPDDSQTGPRKAKAYHQSTPAHLIVLPIVFKKELITGVFILLSVTVPNDCVPCWFSAKLFSSWVVLEGQASSPLPLH